MSNTPAGRCVACGKRTTLECARVSCSNRKPITAGPPPVVLPSGRVPPLYPK